jgi:hypothetical protein
VKVKTIMLSKPAAGLRQHQGEIVTTKTTDESGAEVMVPIEVEWESFTDPDDYAVLVARYTHPSRRTHKDGTRVKHRWSGIAVCGVCDGRQRHTGRTEKYTCRDKGCSARDAALLDAWLTEQALLMLERTDAAVLFRVVDADATESQTALQEAKTLRAELDGWRQDAIAGKVSRASFIEIEAGLNERIRQADERAQRATLPPVLNKVVGPGAREAFLSLDLAEQRDVLRTIMRPRIGKTKRRLRDTLDHATIDPGFLIARPEPEPLAAAA